MGKEVVFRKVPMREIFERLTEEHRQMALEKLKRIDPLVEKGILTLTKEEHEDLMAKIKRYSEAEDKKEEVRRILEIIESHINTGKLLEYEMDEKGSIKINPEFVKHRF